MLQRFTRTFATLGVIVTAPIMWWEVRHEAPAPVHAARSVAQDWCDRQSRHGDDHYRHCEVREFTLAATGGLVVDARPNGGVDVEAWDRSEVRIQARVVGRAESEARAVSLVESVEIEAADGRVEASGPRNDREEHWSVSFRVRVPAEYDLALSSTNGGIGVEGVSGEMDVRTTNGGLKLQDVGGDVRGRTQNGGLDVELSGRGWDGAGLDVRTTNGGIQLALPDGYAADLETGTVNGGIRIDFPITVSGRITRRLSTELGGGGAPLRLMTTNGGVRITRSD